ncbi:MAG: NADH-quinone oxidoreductase subunit J [Bacteroidota bacterium]
MTASQIIFYVLSAGMLLAAVLAVTTRKIFRAAIWLLFCLMGIAGLYFWLEVAFIAAVQVIVYAGGIVVLIIFSIFLTQQSGKEMPRPVGSRRLFAVLSVLFGCGFTCLLIGKHGFKETAGRPFTADVADIGTQMLSTTEHGYVLPFEAVSMLLLAAMVGCIVIAMKDQAHTEQQPSNTHE